MGTRCDECRTVIRAAQISRYRRSDKRKLQRQEYYRKNIDKIYKVQSAYRETPGYYVRRMVQQCRRRAKLLNLPFDLTENDIVIPAVCPVLGMPIQFNRGALRDNSISIDRLIPGAGYVRGNVAIISKRANTIKSNATAAELRAVAAWLETKTKGAILVH